MTDGRPPVQRLGNAVLLQGPILAELRWALGVGINVIGRRDAVVPRSLMMLRSELTRAIADGGNEVMPQESELEYSNQRDGLGSAEAAALLGLQPRQIRNLRDRLGGRRVGQAWIFDRDAVEAEAERRKGPACR